MREAEVDARISQKKIKVEKLDEPKPKPRRKKQVTVKLSKNDLTTDILREARVIGLEPGSAQVFAEKVAGKVAAWAKKRSTVTNEDLDRMLGKELERYNWDLSYIFKNRGKII